MRTKPMQVKEGESINQFGHVRLTLWIPWELKAWLAAEAVERHISVSDLVAGCVRAVQRGQHAPLIVPTPRRRVRRPRRSTRKESDT